MFFDTLENRRLFAAPTPLESAMVGWINRDRNDPAAAVARVGATLPDGVTADAKPALVWDDALGDAAQAWADWNAANHTLTHVGADGSVPLDRAKRFDSAAVYDVENAGLTGPVYTTDEQYLTGKAQWLHDQFVGHAGHFIQMMDPATRSVGVGFATGIYQGIFCLWIVVEMGTIHPRVGDANGDGLVDTRDFVAMAQHFGQTPAPAPEGINPPAFWAWERGDFNGDGVTNAIDFNVLASNFGN